MAGGGHSCLYPRRRHARRGGVESVKLGGVDCGAGVPAMSALLLVATLYPLLLFAVFAWRPRQHYSRWWIVSAPLPALMLSIGLPDTTIQFPFLLLGVVWELDPFTRPLLMMTALLWLVAGYFALGYMQADGLRRFTLCWLATLVGNLSLILGKDIASFYTGFAFMTFAGY